MTFQCPKCKSSDSLSIYHDIGCRTSVDQDANVTDSVIGDLEWLETDDALCMHCDWEGTVEQMTIDDTELETKKEN